MNPMAKSKKNKDGQVIYCPTKERYPGDLVGCGSRNLAGPDDEGLYDCLDCGIFFEADAIEGLPAWVTPEILKDELEQRRERVRDD
jgi:hypothetical protein